MHRILNIGDRIFHTFPTTDGTWKPSQATVWGIHYGRYNEIIGIDALAMRHTAGNIYPNEATLDKKHYTSQPNWLNKSTFTGRRLKSIPVDSRDLHHENIAPLKTHFLPDLISARSISLVHSTADSHQNHLNFLDTVTRKGIAFSQLNSTNITSEHIPIDTTQGCEENDLYNTQPAGMTQSDVDAIAQWSLLYNKQCREQGERVQWPPLGIWPYWQTLTFQGREVQCCSKETLEARERRSTKPWNPTALTPRP